MYDLINVSQVKSTLFSAFESNRYRFLEYTEDLETLSDFDGIVYIKIDNGKNWKVGLKRELEAVDILIC